jgi:hypothetical protein
MEEAMRETHDEPKTDDDESNKHVHADGVLLILIPSPEELTRRK